MDVGVTVISENVTDKEIQWTILNQNVVDIESREIIIKKTGNTRLTATCTNAKTASFTDRATL